MPPVSPAVARLPTPPWALGPGLALCALLAVAGIALGHVPWLQSLGLGPLTLAIGLGLVVGHLLPGAASAACEPGVGLSKQTLLRLGVVLYGLRLTLADVGHIGLAGVAIDAAVLGSTFALACVAGVRWFGLPWQSAVLIGAGSSICGAAAVMATEPVVRARSEQVSVAVACVVLFGTLATLAYPLLFRLDARWHLLAGSARALGVYSGSTIHELAQVVAAARAAGAEAADAAVITKMVRVMMLAPFLLALSAWVARRLPGQPGARPRPTVPGFVLAFVAVVVLNSALAVPPAWRAAADSVTTLLLAMAMGALGVATRWAALRRAGARPLLLGALLAVWLMTGGAAINHWLGGALA